MGYPGLSLFLLSLFTSEGIHRWGIPSRRRTRRKRSLVGSAVSRRTTEAAPFATNLRGGYPAPGGQGGCWLDKQSRWTPPPNRALIHSWRSMGAPRIGLRLTGLGGGVLGGGFHRRPRGGPEGLLAEQAAAGPIDTTPPPSHPSSSRKMMG